MLYEIVPVPRFHTRNELELSTHCGNEISSPGTDVANSGWTFSVSATTQKSRPPKLGMVLNPSAPDRELPPMTTPLLDTTILPSGSGNGALPSSRLPPINLFQIWSP